MNAPRARTTAINAPFWEVCNRDVLILQPCEAAPCGRAVFYPRVCCPFCGHGGLRWEQASGRSAVSSVTRVHRPGHDAFIVGATYMFAAVALQEGATLYGRLEAGSTDLDGLIGRLVRAEFHPDLPGQKLIRFVLLEAPP